MKGTSQLSITSGVLAIERQPLMRSAEHNASMRSQSRSEASHQRRQGCLLLVCVYANDWCVSYTIGGGRLSEIFRRRLRV